MIETYLGVDIEHVIKNGRTVYKIGNKSHFNLQSAYKQIKHTVSRSYVVSNLIAQGYSQNELKLSVMNLDTVLHRRCSRAMLGSHLWDNWDLSLQPM